MGDLPLGQGHAKHSDPSRLEATRDKVARKTKANAPAPPLNGAQPPQPEVHTLDAEMLEGELARYRHVRKMADAKRLDMIIAGQETMMRQLKEMNWYLRQGALNALGIDTSDPKAMQAFDGAVLDAINPKPAPAPVQVPQKPAQAA